MPGAPEFPNREEENIESNGFEDMYADFDLDDGIKTPKKLEDINEATLHRQREEYDDKAETTDNLTKSDDPDAIIKKKEEDLVERTAPKVADDATEEEKKATEAARNYVREHLEKIYDDYLEAESAETEEQREILHAKNVAALSIDLKGEDTFPIEFYEKLAKDIIQIVSDPESIRRYRSLLFAQEVGKYIRIDKELGTTFAQDFKDIFDKHALDKEDTDEEAQRKLEELIIATALFRAGVLDKLAEMKDNPLAQQLLGEVWEAQTKEQKTSESIIEISIRKALEADAKQEKKPLISKTAKNVAKVLGALAGAMLFFKFSDFTEANDGSYYGTIEGTEVQIDKDGMFIVEGQRIKELTPTSFDDAKVRSTGEKLGIALLQRKNIVRGAVMKLSDVDIEDSVFMTQDDTLRMREYSELLLEDREKSTEFLMDLGVIDSSLKPNDKRINQFVLAFANYTNGDHAEADSMIKDDDLKLLASHWDTMKPGDKLLPELSQLRRAEAAKDKLDA